MTSEREDLSAFPHLAEPHSSTSKLNWLRASVLGANDGIVSVALLVVGVASSDASRTAVFTAGVSGLVAGAVSMALGEYVSVSSQRDSERALLALERRELQEEPDEEFEELVKLYELKGLRTETARVVAKELTEHDVLAAHLDAELHLDAEDFAKPWQAAGASALSFVLGAILPLVAILLPPASLRVIVTAVAVLVALAVAGVVSAKIGGGKIGKAVIRVVCGGAAGLAVSYGIGQLFGTVTG